VSRASGGHGWHALLWQGVHSRVWFWPSHVWHGMHMVSEEPVPASTYSPGSHESAVSAECGEHTPKSFQWPGTHRCWQDCASQKPADANTQPAPRSAHGAQVEQFARNSPREQRAASQSQQVLS